MTPTLIEGTQVILKVKLTFHFSSECLPEQFQCLSNGRCIPGYQYRYTNPLCFVPQNASPSSSNALATGAVSLVTSIATALATAMTHRMKQTTVYVVTRGTSGVRRATRVYRLGRDVTGKCSVGMAVMRQVVVSVFCVPFYELDACFTRRSLNIVLSIIDTMKKDQNEIRNMKISVSFIL